MAPHSNTLTWKIPWTEKPGGLRSVGSLGVGTRLSDFTLSFRFHALEKEMATHSSVLAWRVPGTAEPGGLLSLGSHRVGHIDWSDLAAAADIVMIKVGIYKVDAIVKWSETRSVVSDSLRPHESTRLLCPWNSPDQNTGVGSHSLLQGIFQTQGLNPGLPRCRQILYQLSHKRSPDAITNILLKTIT